MKQIIVISFVFLFIVGCKTNNKGLKYEIIHLEEVIPLIENTKDSVGYHIDYKYIKFYDISDKSISVKIKKKIDEDFFGLPNIYLTNDPTKDFDLFTDSISVRYREEVLPLIKSVGNMTYLLNHELVKTSKVVFNRNNLLVLEIETFVYRGGAHGLSEKNYLHFDLNTGKCFNLTEALFDGGKEELSKQIIKRCNELKAKEDCMIFKDVDPELTNNFYFDEKKFYFVYNPYEIAPYAAGYIEIDIPIKKIERFIDGDGPLGFVK